MGRPGRHRRDAGQRAPGAGRAQLFLLRLNLARIDDGLVRQKLYDRVPAYWRTGASSLLAAAVAIPAVLYAFAHDIIDPARAVAWSGTGLAATLAGGLAWRRVAQSGVRAGGDGKPQPAPVVIFIDDLDRCAPNKVAAIVEGINAFLAGDRQAFMFIIGMDPQMAAAALEHAHKDVRSQLPRYERNVPLGWRFMDKFIQLAFTIPPRRAAAIGAFVQALTPGASSAWTGPIPVLLAGMVASSPPRKLLRRRNAQRSNGNGLPAARSPTRAVTCVR